jgi:hypothetical protein
VKRWLRIIGKDFRRRFYRAPFFVEVIGLLVLGGYAWAAHHANQLARRTLITTQRSHFGITNTDVTANKADDFRVQLTFENQGNSPSTQVRLDLWITDWGVARHDQIVSVPKTLGFGDFPFQTGTVYHSSVNFDGFTNKQWTDVTIHQSFLKITGSLEYNDGFETVRETGICFRYNGNWEVCPINDADLIKTD